MLKLSNFGYVRVCLVSISFLVSSSYLFYFQGIVKEIEKKIFISYFYSLFLLFSSQNSKKNKIAKQKSNKLLDFYLNFLFLLSIFSFNYKNVTLFLIYFLFLWFCEGNSKNKKILFCVFTISFVESWKWETNFENKMTFL